MTHGLTDAQFFEMVSSFLGPFYIALALMNGLAALYLWRSGQLKTWFKLGKGIEFSNVIGWLAFAMGFSILGAIAGGGMASSLSLPESFREAINESTGPITYSLGTTVILIVLFFGRSFFVRPAVAWTIWNLMWLFLGL